MTIRIKLPIMLGPPRSFSVCRLASVVVLVFVLLLVSSQLSAFSTTRSVVKWLRTNSSTPRISDHDARCLAFPDPGNVAIAVKTGATEAVGKVPTLMLTTLRCAQNVMIFSDLEQRIAGYQLHDALKDVPESAMEGNSDFEFYKKLREWKKYGQIEAMLKGAPDPRRPEDLAAWTLDKYKQLHILEILHTEYPDKDWYLMIDADTYLVWPNFLTWLQKLPDPASTALYLGAPANVGEVQFAHGGSGILISRKTMYDFAVVNAGVAAKWDKSMRDECCGDYVIGKVLKENGITLKPSWPTVNGQRPTTIPFGPSHWCQTVVTMHHAGPHEMDQLVNFELSRNDIQEPLTFAELYNAFIKDTLPETFDDWDSNCLDGVVELDSFESCREECKKDWDCFQFAYHGKECTLSHSMHLGEPKRPENGNSWRSGWLKNRIRDWVDRQAPCQPEFPWISTQD